MSAYNFSPNTDITDPVITQIMEYLVKEKIVDKSNIRMSDNLEGTETTHISIFFAVDLSGSIRPYIDDINRTIKKFVSTVAAKNSYIADSIDFCYVTFNETVNVRRPLGYLSSDDIDAPWTTIRKEELGGLTDIASALFTTWYMAEERKKYLRDERQVQYIQPIIIMISDLMHNVDIPVPGISDSEDKFLDVIIELLKFKVASSSKKVGLAKFAPITQNEILSDEDAKKIYELNEYNFELKNTDEFAALLDRFFKELTATVMDPTGKKRVLKTDDEGRLRRNAMSITSPANVSVSSSKSEHTPESQSDKDNNVGSFFDSLFD